MDIENKAEQYGEDLLSKTELNTYKNYSLEIQKSAILFSTYYIEQAYDDGYNDALKDLWHSADDKPEKGKWILVKSVYGGYYAVTTQHYPKTIIDKWCYINDIETDKDGKT